MKVEFGIQIETHVGFDYPTALKIATEAEKLGFDGLFMCDHLRPRIEGGIRPDVDILDTWTTLPALAAKTERIQLGTLCTCASFRSPSLLAKMAATLDAISNGRLVFGIGAGWYQPEYEAYGYEFPSNRERIQRLSEAVKIIKKMWSEERPTYHGKYHQIDQALSHPKPIQKPHPPIWIGGSGEKLLLRVVAEEADACNFLMMSPEEYRAKVRVLEEHCRDVGRNLDEIKRTLYTGGIIARDEKSLPSKVIAHYGRTRKAGESDAELVRRNRERTGRMIGTADDWTRKIREFQRLGVSYFIWYLPDLRELESLRILAESVLPEFVGN